MRMLYPHYLMPFASYGVPSKWIDSLILISNSNEVITQDLTDSS